MRLNWSEAYTLEDEVIMDEGPFYCHQLSCHVCLPVKLMMFGWHTNKQSFLVKSSHGWGDLAPHNRAMGVHGTKINTTN